LTRLDPVAYDETLHDVIVPILDHTYTYTLNLKKKLQKQGYFTIAISGSREEEVELFVKHHNFDDWTGQKLHRTNDGKKFTGEVTKTHTDKRHLLEKLIAKHDLTYDGSYGVGDTGGDIELLHSVENPIRRSSDEPG